MIPANQIRVPLVTRRGGEMMFVLATRSTPHGEHPKAERARVRRRARARVLPPMTAARQITVISCRSALACLPTVAADPEPCARCGFAHAHGTAVRIDPEVPRQFLHDNQGH